MVPPEGRDDLRDIVLTCGPDYTVRRRFAGGGFVYIGIRNPDNAALSMWELAFYDGSQLATPRGKKMIPLFVFALTGPRGVIERGPAEAT
jgi:hypothetical protein